MSLVVSDTSPTRSSRSPLSIPAMAKPSLSPHQWWILGDTEIHNKCSNLVAVAGGQDAVELEHLLPLRISECRCLLRSRVPGLPGSPPTKKGAYQRLLNLRRTQYLKSSPKSLKVSGSIAYYKETCKTKFGRSKYQVGCLVAGWPMRKPFLLWPHFQDAS